MHIGLILPHWTNAMGGETASAADVVAFAKQAEEIGIDGVWLTDHLYHEPYLDFREHGYELPAQMQGVRTGFWEAWTLLAAIASETQNVEIGTLVSNTRFRNPSLLAKMAETVDSISDGRLTFGLGAGDFRSEHEFLGYPWEYRISQFEEALQIITPLLRGERVSYAGNFYNAYEAKLLPRGPRDSGPPLLVGMMRNGPRMQRLAVQYADGWSCWLAFEDSYADGYAERAKLMREACDRYDRDPDTLRNTVTVGVNAPDYPSMVPGATPITGSADEITEKFLRFRDLGVQHLAVYLQPCTLAGLEWLAAIVEQVRKERSTVM
jgi:alkanesulfonate monooxygenase SsuD/methylene tetrahydromethanopterin reductase-like flavin-dependent oxidoreductase (luciferase family)